MASAPCNEVVAYGTPDGRALVRLGDREFCVERRDAAGRMDMPALCPVEMVLVSLAA